LKFITGTADVKIRLQLVFPIADSTAIGGGGGTIIYQILSLSLWMCRKIRYLMHTTAVLSSLKVLLNGRKER
jgi:hypothetical protein